MKIIEQFVQAVLSIMRLRKSGDLKAAIAQIQTAIRFYLKCDLFFLIYCPLDKIFDHFKNSAGEIDTQRCILCGDLLYELALINEEKKENAAALYLKTLCLNLYSFAIAKEEQF